MITLYREGKLSLSTLATRLELSVSETIGLLAEFGIESPIDYDDYLKGDDGNCCRLLIGMQKPPLEILRENFYKTEQDIIDNQTASAIKKKLAQEFKDQLTIGIPTEEDEIGLRKLSQQIKDKKVIVKLFLRHPLHAKLYLLFSDGSRSYFPDRLPKKVEYDFNPNDPKDQYA